jgi:hypothetical protein
MNREKHIERHKELHKVLDELVADFVRHSEGYPLLSDTTVMKFMEWSHQQTINPTEEQI